MFSYICSQYAEYHIFGAIRRTDPGLMNSTVMMATLVNLDRGLCYLKRFIGHRHGNISIFIKVSNQLKCASRSAKEFAGRKERLLE